MIRYRSALNFNWINKFNKYHTFKKYKLNYKMRENRVVFKKFFFTKFFKYYNTFFNFYTNKIWYKVRLCYIKEFSIFSSLITFKISFKKISIKSIYRLYFFQNKKFKIKNYFLFLNFFKKYRTGPSLYLEKFNIINNNYVVNVKYMFINLNINFNVILLMLRSIYSINSIFLLKKVLLK